MKNLYWEQIKPNIFYIQDEKTGLVYAPLLSQFFEVGEDGRALIQDYMEQGYPEYHEFHRVLENKGFLENVDLPKTISKYAPFEPTELIISLTSACNLRCIYCYADAGNQTSNLPWHIVKEAIDKMFHYVDSANNRDVAITFHGGGEPTILWDRLVSSVEYALSIEGDWDIVFSLVTNATLITKERAEWLASHNFQVSVSLDGTEDIHNLQRPTANGDGSFRSVMHGVQNLIDAKARFGFRATITGQSQHQLVELVELSAQLGAVRLAVVPFSAYGRGVTGITPVDPEIFASEFIRARRKADAIGFSIRTTSDDLTRIDARFCAADGEIFAVMSDGIISSCPRVTRKTDKLSQYFSFGSWNSDGIVINYDKVKDLRGMNLYSNNECDDCFARFTCSGGCHADRFDAPNKIMPELFCTITRAITWLSLLEHLDVGGV